jgi:alkaline phosphatase D
MRKRILNTHRYSFYAYALATFIIAFLACNAQKQNNSDQYVVVLSLDAFRWDYSTMANTPNLNSIAQNGVTTKSFIPCYPSKTFPNHYSMATGLHPNNHGIVCNSFFDPELGYYSLGDRDAVMNANFYGGEPFWVTAENQGIKAATFYWVGSEAPVGGNYPSFWKIYDQKVPFENRIDTVIHWLTLPVEERPHLVAWYFHEPDGISHREGPTAPKTIAMVEMLDSLVGVFLDRVAKLPHAKQINIIIVSDHGMSEITPEKYINLTEYVDKDWFEYITGGNPVYGLTPKEEFRQQAISALKSIPNLKVWERKEIPERLHYGSNPRIQDILIEADAGYSVGLKPTSRRYSGGAHGYDNENPDMHGIFYAQGPAFKKGYKHKSILNLNLYTIITHTLGLTPSKNDGDWEDVKEMFVESE